MPARRVTLPPSRIQAKRRRRRNTLLISIGVVIVLLLVGVVVAFRAPQWQINQVSVSGDGGVSSQALVAYVSPMLSGAYLYIFPKDNVLLYPKEEVLAGVRTQFPSIKNLSVAVKAQTLQLTVSGRSAVAQWCGGEVASSSSCYLLDNTGVAYAPAPVGSSYLSYFGPIATGTLPWQFVSAKEFSALNSAIASMQQKIGQPISYVTIDSGGEVTIVFNSGFSILFLLSENPTDVVTALSLAFTSDVFTTHSLSDFIYLDLRFGDKLYYKLKSP